MNAGWIGSLGEALSVLLDHRGKTPKKLETDWAEDGVRVLSALHVKGGRVRSEPQRYVPMAIYDRWMPVKLEARDILLTSEAPLGEVAFLPDRVEACLGQRLFGLRPNPDILDARYLYYLLHHSSIRSQLLQRSSGTTVAGIRQAELIQVRLDLPPMPTQRAVSSALGAFDDLIENNRRRIEILEEMARLLYREWFVHFRFPGHEDVGLVDSELGPIPEGWEVGGLTSLCSLVMGQSPKSEFYNEHGEGLPFHQGVTDFGFRYPTHRKWTTVENV
ncbi:restriction endonuclease subunit S [Acidimicrobiaceae bacterium]|nr:restriction endonuclease subunit S [Acidimicrobiaceae bacterium]